MAVPTLITTQNQMNFYGYPIVMVLGIIGNIFILILFNRQRHNACSLYLMHSAIANSLYLIIIGFFQIFAVSSYDQTLGALILCKFNSYTPGCLGQVAKTILILACIDRYMITSDQARFRAFSTPKRAKYLILFSYIFWLIVASHLLIWTITINGQCTRVGIYATIFTFYAILVVGLIPAIILCIFGYLTYRNMRRLRSRVQPTSHEISNTNHSIQRRDRDLIILVIAETIVYIITTSLFPAILLEMTITSSVMPNKPFQYILTEVFTLNVALLLLFIYSAAPFYTFMISSGSFRRDFKQLIKHGYRKVTGQPSELTTNRTRQIDTHHGSHT